MALIAVLQVFHYDSINNYYLFNMPFKLFGGIDMMKAFFLATLLFLIACNDSRIDASSDDKLEASIEEIASSLNDAEKKEFQDALMFIALQKIDFSGLMSRDLDSEEIVSNYLNQIKNEIDGKTAADVIAHADKLRDDLSERQKKQALNEIAELEEKSLQAKLAKEELSKFEVIRSRFYKEKDFIGDRPIIEITVRNNSPYAISRIFFKGTYATPNRQVPWLVDDFNYRISGGLEPNEEQSWQLAPNMYGEWGRLDERSDAILSLEVIRVDGPEGDLLLSAQGLSSYEESRLQELRNTYLK